MCSSILICFPRGGDGPLQEFLKAKIVEYFRKQGEEATVKYIDPSYMIRWVGGWMGGWMGGPAVCSVKCAADMHLCEFVRAYVCGQ